MTVKELIAQLGAFHPETTVVVGEATFAKVGNKNVPSVVKAGDEVEWVIPGTDKDGDFVAVF